MVNYHYSESNENLFASGGGGGAIYNEEKQEEQEEDDEGRTKSHQNSAKTWGTSGRCPYRLCIPTENRISTVKLPVAVSYGALRLCQRV